MSWREAARVQGLREAAGLMNAYGFERVRAAELARTCGLSVGTLYPVLLDTSMRNIFPSSVVSDCALPIVPWSSFAPPPFVGTPPTGAPPDDPGARTMDKFFGGPPQVSDDPDVLLGTAGSPGVVRGRARVIRDLADAYRLKPGEIMVTETTAPAWTPLFATASAVVTDTGGVLSHCAVVAREYRIPAVVGTGFGQGRTDGLLVDDPAGRER